MARRLMSLFGVVVAAVALGVPAQGAAAARTPPQDFVVGGGNVGMLQDISIDARSDALGGNVSGTVSFRVVIFPGLELLISGPVTCLAVNGAQAVIGFTDTSGILGAATIVITDRGPFTELRRDLWTLDPFGPTDCSPRDLAADNLSSGDFMVRDAPSTDQCRNGGWRNYTNAAGQPFKNQGQCIAFALGVA
jgi:hypothetical protein